MDSFSVDYTIFVWFTLLFVLSRVEFQVKSHRSSTVSSPGEVWHCVTNLEERQRNILKFATSHWSDQSLNKLHPLQPWLNQVEPDGLIVPRFCTTSPLTALAYQVDQTSVGLSKFGVKLSNFNQIGLCCNSDSKSISFTRLKSNFFFIEFRVIFFFSWIKSN